MQLKSKFQVESQKWLYFYEFKGIWDLKKTTKNEYINKQTKTKQNKTK